MLSKRPITTYTDICVCDRCGREMANDATDGEWEERITIAFRGGYHSVFGDGSLVECDLCQHCVKVMLEKHLRITLDDPFDPRFKLQFEQHHAYQHYQLREEAQLGVLREEVEGTFRQFRKKLEAKDQNEVSITAVE